MLPFLKNKQEGSMSGPVESMKIGPDEGDESYGMLDAVVEDMLEAIGKKDKTLLKGALQALVEHIQDADAIQDQE